jgi:hypothetical protein
MSMKRIVKKVLKETYEQQFLDNICQTLSTGSNPVSPKFMNYMINQILKSDLPPNIKKDVMGVYNKWKSDMFTSVNNGKDEPYSPLGSTGDSESDISDMYLTQIQDIICSNYLEELD